ncbi:MAG TPA: riboflavin synthase [Candidatus Polarisedimenticolaceae bacterium]|nr:riboflavin synthase [Candidatus Polarisedimenticolaceae bacterium]
MFTGLIRTIGRVVRVEPGAGATRLAVASDLPVETMEDGESVAVDGVCLTVARREGDVFEADAVAETLARTTLSGLARGDRVHLERALAMGERLGGHLVQGHVDAVARVLRATRSGADVRLEVELPVALRGLVARKGSIAVSGVSLTVAAVGPASFEVALIPETLARTRLGELAEGDPVNLEADLIARYLEALLRERSP